MRRVLPDTLRNSSENNAPPSIYPRGGGAHPSNKNTRLPINQHSLYLARMKPSSPVLPTCAASSSLLFSISGKVRKVTANFPLRRPKGSARRSVWCAYCTLASRASFRRRPLSSSPRPLFAPLAPPFRGLLPSSTSRPPQQCAEKLPERLFGIPPPLSSSGYRPQELRKRSKRVGRRNASSWPRSTLRPRVGREHGIVNRGVELPLRLLLSQTCPASLPPPQPPRCLPRKTVKVKLIRGIYRGAVRKRLCAVFLSGGI